MDALEVKSISKSYGSNIALENVNLNIPKGSIYGLLGPNGAGKTTLIRILNQIIFPDSGEIYMNGERLSPELVRRIGYLPEERGLYSDMKVYDQLIYFAHLKRMSTADAQKQIKFWFDRLDMQTFVHRKITELSKGMAQKVQFVLSILHQPDFLIFDEVFSGFDPVNANLIKEQILYLNEQGTTILFSSHRMENVEEICTHAALIHHAHLVLDGSMEDIKAKYREKIYDVRTESPIVLDERQGYTIIQQATHEGIIQIADDKTTKDVLPFLLAQNDITHFSEVIPSLHEIFVKTVSDEV